MTGREAILGCGRGMVDRATVLSDSSWSPRAQGKFLMYFGPHLMDSLPPSWLQTVLKEKRAYGAVYSYDWDHGREGPWYSLVCDGKDYDIEQVPSGNTRSKVRRALKRCGVEKVGVEWLAERGHRVYEKAQARYGQVARDSVSHFRNRMKEYVGRDDLDIYAVLVEGELAAYGMAFRRHRGIRLSTTCFDPTFSSAYPMYALFFTMTRDYLRDGQFDFVDNGSRPLLHETNIEEFLFGLGWRKAYCRLDAVFTWRLNLICLLFRLLRPWAQQIVPTRHRAILSALIEVQTLRMRTQGATFPSGN